MTVILTTRPLYQGWLNLLMVDMRAANGELFERHVVEMNRAVAVLPYDAERRTALTVSMPRTPVMLAGLPDMMEAIAGILEDEPADCARREALEEAPTTASPQAAGWTRSRKISPSTNCRWTSSGRCSRKNRSMTASSPSC
jgi:8-oxo-dGTP pyrophosphatase MutT (NUDIX family)